MPIYHPQGLPIQPGPLRCGDMLGRILIGLGIASIVAGLVLLYAPGLFGWFGKLPGDIDISRDGTRIFIPVTSMIIISLLLTIIINLFFRR